MEVDKITLEKLAEMKKVLDEADISPQMDKAIKKATDIYDNISKTIRANPRIHEIAVPMPTGETFTLTKDEWLSYSEEHIIHELAGLYI